MATEAALQRRIRELSSRLDDLTRRQAEERKRMESEAIR